MFAQTETQQLMVEMADRLLARENQFEARRLRLSANPPDCLALWPLLAEQGLIGALACEDAGGFGGSARDLASLTALAGKRLVVEPLLHAALCLAALTRSGNAGLVAQIIGGQAIAVFAHQEGSDPFAAPACRFARDRDGVVLNGTKLLVRHGDLAQWAIVSGVLDGQPALALVAIDQSGVARESTRLIDASSAATFRFDGARGFLLAADAGSMLERLIALQLAGLSAEAAGILRAACDETFAYLVTRKQFGAPLASFQALQHRAADMQIAAEEARVLAARAADLIDADSPGAALMAAATKARIDDLARRAIADAVQLHGGIGVSDELAISHYFHRVTAIRAEGGAAEDLRAHVAASGKALPLTEGESSEIAAFRREVAAFTRQTLDASTAAKGALGLKLDKQDYVAWQKALHAKGWFAAGWPAGHGGPAWDIERQLVMLQEAALNSAPLIIPYGVSMVGPVLLEFGTQAQKDRHLPGILSSDVWWCQGYSEPNSGSDLASLRTTAVRDGDDYVVNGTKMWTTEAHWADWMHCLVRTDKEVKPQAGISFLLIDMTTPGIEIRPIVTIDGQHHTNQVFLDNVRVPAENLVGGEGQGWSIAKFLLANERVAIADTGPKMRLLAQLRALFVAQVAADALSPARQALLADRLAAVEAELAMLVALEQDYVRMWAGGGAKTGPQASILKVRGTEILQSLAELALAIEGPLGAVHDPVHLHLPPDRPHGPHEAASTMAHQYLYSRCWSIFGGTNEIQRNIIAGSVLR
jgi:alkylation response protein AidB-like acyl-CoA dehydrogenase